MENTITEIDLFEQYHLLPQNMQDLLLSYGDFEETYENCEKLLKDCQAFDYYLDALPYNLRLLTTNI